MEQKEGPNPDFGSVQRKVEVIRQPTPGQPAIVKIINTMDPSAASKPIIAPGTSVLKNSIVLPNRSTLLKRVLPADSSSGQLVVQQIVHPPALGVLTKIEPRRVVVEHIADAGKLVGSLQQQQRKEVTIVNSPSVQQVFYPQRPTVQNVILNKQIPLRAIAPKPDVIQKGLTAMPVTVVKKVEASKDPSKLEKIVIVRKTPSGQAEIVKVPPQMQAGSSSSTSNTAAPTTQPSKVLTGEEKLDALMKDLLEADAAKTTKPESETFQQKELQLIQKLKRNPQIHASHVKIAPKPPQTPEKPVPQFTYSTVSVPRTPPATSSSVPPISPNDPKLAYLVKTASDKLAAGPVKVALGDKFQEMVKQVLDSAQLKPPERPKFDEKHISFEISGGRVSSAKTGGTMKLVKEYRKNPRMQGRAQSLVSASQPRVQIRSSSVSEDVEAEEKVEAEIIPVYREEDAKALLCDENIEQVSPDKAENEIESKTVQGILRKGRRKTAHKTLLDDKTEDSDESVDVGGPCVARKEEKAADDASEDEEECEKKVRNACKRKFEEQPEEEADDGVFNDVWHVSVAKLFDGGYEADDIYLSDPFSHIKWKDGIGSLRNGSIHFKINEYGIYEVMSNDDFYKAKRDYRPEPHLEESIAIRPGVRKRHLPHKSVYECAVCTEKGVAEEFLEPDICSWMCREAWQAAKAPKKVKLEPAEDEEDASFGTHSTENEADVEDETMTSQEDESLIRETDAPLSLFKNPSPSTPNGFQVGIKLEAIDPFNQALFCVCTVVDKRGFRIKIRFDGYSAEYDFWTNADSKQIFPPGWCAATDRNIEPPAEWPVNKSFNWNEYLKNPKVMASVHLFPHLKEEVPPKWEIGRKLEADLPEGEGDGVTAATIRDIIGRRALIHLDFYKTDFWVDVDSPLIHPVDWHQEMKQPFNSPSRDFSWRAYLRTERATKLPDDCLVPRPPLPFRPGMKLEVVDPKNTSLIRPATVVNVDGYRIRILFDGWPAHYAYWTADDNPDLHPTGYARVTKHPLETVGGSGTHKNSSVCSVFKGCRGIGNSRNKSRPYHRDPEECPYSKENWREPESSDRLRPLKFRKSAWRRLKDVVEPGPVDSSELGDSEDEDKSLSLRKIPTEEAVMQREDLWKMNCERLPAVASDDESSVLYWTPEQVAKFVSSIPGCEVTGTVFIQEEINGSAFLSLSKDDLKAALKLKVGPALKIYSRVIELRESALKDLTK